MMAMLWVIEIINGNATFADVPSKLKEKVRKLLKDSGMGELADD